MNFKRLWIFFDKAITRVNHIGVIISVLCLIIIMLMSVSDVIGDKVFNHGIPSNKELLSNLNVVLVFMSVAFVTLERGHITMNVLENKSSRKLIYTLKLCGYVLSVLFCGFFTWRTFVYMQRMIERVVLNSGQINFPLWPFGLMLFIGCVLLTISFIHVFIRDGIIDRTK